MDKPGRDPDFARKMTIALVIVAVVLALRLAGYPP